MKRFVTYLYAYKNGQKMKSAGFVRVDVKGLVLDMQINIRDAELDNAKGIFYIILRMGDINRIPLVDIWVKDGVFCGKASYNYDRGNEVDSGFETIIGVGVEFENGAYMASCWKDGEEEVVAGRDCGMCDKTEQIINTIVCEDCDMEDIDIIEENNSIKEEDLIDTNNPIEEKIKAASVDIIEDFHKEIEPCYQKINLNEIYTLPSQAWHFSNNSFLLHGFWNYGYLVLKETMEENQKRIALGVPGIFEQPEMVMATYFGFPEFETLPSKAIELNMGERYMYSHDTEKQPKAGAMGCWFINL